MEVLSRLIPFFAIMALGAVLARVRLLDLGHVRGLSRYVLWIGFPALLIHTLSQVARPDVAQARWLAGYAAGAAAPYLIGWALTRLKPFQGEAGAVLPLAAGAGNDAFLDLPLAVSLGGGDAARFGGPMVALAWGLLVPAGIAVLHRRATGEGVVLSIGRAMSNPVTVGALVGVALMLAGVRPDGPIGDLLARLAASTVPVGLVAVGAVAAMRREPGHAPPAHAPVLAASAVRLLAAPVCIWVGTTLAGAPAPYVALALLIGSGPTAVTVFIQAQAYERFATGAARIVALSAVGSIVTLSWLASRLG